MEDTPVCDKSGEDEHDLIAALVTPSLEEHGLDAEEIREILKKAKGDPELTQELLALPSSKKIPVQETDTTIEVYPGSKLDPDPTDLNCCQNMIEGLVNHLSGSEKWSDAQIYYDHAKTCDRFPASTYSSWIDSKALLTFNKTCQSLSDISQLSAAIDRHKYSKVELEASDIRGLMVASSLAAMKSPFPVDHMWHSLRMLHDFSEVGSNYHEVQNSIARVGPIHNVLDEAGIPVAGHLRGKKESEEDGWLDVDIIEFSSGDYSVVGTPSGPLVPMVTQADLDVAVQLAFFEGPSPVAPSFSLDRAPSKRNDMRLDRKTFSPSWLAATPFGQSMYLADWLMKSFSMRDGLPSLTDPLASGATVEGWRPPAVVDAASHATGSMTLPDGTIAEHARMEIVAQSANLDHATFNRMLFWKVHQYRLNSVDVFVESSLYSGDDDSRNSIHHFKNDPSTDPGACADVITKNYEYISNLYPVFGRVQLILGLFSLMCQARRDGVKLSDAARKRLTARVAAYKADMQKNYPEYELSPKPFHKGGCYCNGGVSGRVTATVAVKQAKPFEPRPHSVSFVVTSAGVSSPVPRGAVPLPTETGQGIRYGGGKGGKWGAAEHGMGEFSERVSEVWVMPATKNHPARTYYKNSGAANRGGQPQKVDPFTGRVIDRNHPLAHIYHESD